MKRLCIVGMLLWLVAGCGQKGALYLPADAQQPQSQTQAERSDARQQLSGERGKGQKAAEEKRQRPRTAVQP